MKASFKISGHQLQRVFYFLDAAHLNFEYRLSKTLSNTLEVVVELPDSDIGKDVALDLLGNLAESCGKDNSTLELM